MLYENEFRLWALDWLDLYIERRGITNKIICEIQDDLAAMGQPSGRADVAIGIMCGWIILQ